jgi:ribonuclease BN (tRNA processing enzyme)
MDLGNLLLGSWPSQPIDIYGPAAAGLPIPGFQPGVSPAFPDEPTPGMRATTDLLLRSFAYNINVRLAGEGRSTVVDRIRVHEIGVSGGAAPADLGLGVVADASSPVAAAPPMDPVVIYPEDDHGVQVSAILVQHAPVFPALGFRFDTPHGSVVFSGDTGHCDNVVRLAQGADVLVHEVIHLDRMAVRLRRLPNFEEVRDQLASSHSSPDQVGDVARRAGVGTLVLSHLVPGDVEVAEDEWEALVRPHFDGDVVCGVDLDEFALTR